MQATIQMPQSGAVPMPLPAMLNPDQHVPAQQQAPTRQPSQRFKKAIFGLGIAEVVVGSILIIFGIATSASASSFSRYVTNGYDYIYGYYGYDACTVNRGYSYISQGIWCGLLTLATGILGIIVKTQTTRCMYIANMAMGIITAVVVFGGFVISSISASAAVPCLSALVALHVIVALLSFAVFVLTVLHASLCCSGVCVSHEHEKVQKMQYLPQYQNIAYGQPHYVQGPNGQLMLVTTVTSPHQMTPSPNQLYPPPTFSNETASAQHQEASTSPD